MKWHLILVLSCFSLTINDVEHLITFLLTCAVGFGSGTELGVTRSLSLSLALLSPLFPVEEVGREVSPTSLELPGSGHKGQCLLVRWGAGGEVEEILKGASLYPGLVPSAL